MTLSLRVCFVVAILLPNVLQAALTPDNQESLQLAGAFTKALSELSNVHFHCPPPFTRILNECFYFNHISPLNWDDARYVCQSSGGDLAQPEHFGALPLFLFTKRILLHVREGMGHRLRLGAREDSAGNWKWVSGTPVDSALKWEENKTNGTSLCMSLVIKAEGAATLIKDDCQAEQYSVCELPI